MYCPTNELDQKYSKNPPAKVNKSKAVNATIVCSFWLNNSCKNGDNCNYLHEDIPEKYPECQYGVNCNKPGCRLKHTKKELKECHAYNSGYCSHGKQCRDCHNQKEICLNYLLGFCPEGPNCPNFHIKTMITPGQDNLDYLSKSLPNLD